MLSYIYADTFDVPVDEVFDLLIAAERYQIDALVERCVGELEDKGLRIEHMAGITKVLTMQNCPDSLEELCVTFLADHFDELAESGEQLPLVHLSSFAKVLQRVRDGELYRQ